MRRRSGRKAMGFISGYKKYLGVTVRNSRYSFSLGLLACGDLEDDCTVASVRNFSASTKCCVSAKIVFPSGLAGHPRTIR